MSYKKCCNLFLHNMGPIYFEENIEGFYTFMILPSTCMCIYTISFSIGFVKDKNLLPTPPPPHQKKKKRKKERKKKDAKIVMPFISPTPLVQLLGKICFVIMERILHSASVPIHLSNMPFGSPKERSFCTPSTFHLR